MLKELLKEFELSDQTIDKLNKLREICLEYNKHTNLTSITDEEEFNIKHILDSLSILKFYKLDKMKILDVGSGGGFPGLVLAIVLEDSEIVMIDSNNKKTKYIDYAIEELALTNARTINSRIEEADLVEEFDVVLSRAVAALNILVEITASSVKKGGLAIYYKGLNLDDELTHDWTHVKKRLGLELNEINDFNLEEAERKIISFKKISSTDEGYPRHYSLIKKKPIF